MKRMIILMAVLSCLAPFSLTAQTKKVKQKDWWVIVRLYNGSYIEGAVLADAFVEKATYGRVYTRVKDLNFRAVPGAGVRLFFVRETPGFMFLPYTQIKELNIRFRLTKKKRRELESRIRYAQIARAKEISEEEKRREEERLKRAGVGLTEKEAAEKKAQEKSDEEKLKNMKVEKAEVMKRLLPQERELLEKYPPGDEWNEEVYRTLNRRYRAGRSGTRIKLITLPDGSKRRIVKRTGSNNFGGLTVIEKQFIDNFDAWRAAVAEYEKQEKELKKELLKKEKEKEKEANKEKSDKEETIEDKDITTLAPLENGEKTPEKLIETPKKSSRETIQEAINQLLYADAAHKKLGAIQILEEYKEKASLASGALSNLAINDESAKVREAAIVALGKIQKPYAEVAQTLVEILDYSDDSNLRLESVIAMKGFKDASVFKEHLDTLNLAMGADSNAKVRYQVIRLLEIIGDSSTKEQITRALVDESIPVRVAACSALASMEKNLKTLKSDWVRDPLIKGIFLKDDQVAILAAKTLKKLNIDDEETKKAIKKALNSELNPEVLNILTSM